MGAGVAVAADDRRARQRHAQLGTDHVHDPLVPALDIVKRDAKLAAVGPHRLELLARQRVADVELVVGRHVVVDRGERQVRPPHPPAGQPQPVKRLRTRHFVDQVPVDIQKRRLVGRRHDVAIPDLLKQCLRHFHSLGSFPPLDKGGLGGVVQANAGSDQTRLGQRGPTIGPVSVTTTTRDRFARTTSHLNSRSTNRLGARPAARRRDTIELHLTIVIG